MLIKTMNNPWPARVKRVLENSLWGFWCRSDVRTGKQPGSGCGARGSVGRAGGGGCYTLTRLLTTRLALPIRRTATGQGPHLTPLTHRCGVRM
jgi:hypothetical protein